MRLSIIIVNWNQRDMLTDCLNSVLDRTNPDSDEIFVVDNGSEDGSAQYVDNHFPTVKLISNSDNRGFAAANNQAIKISKGRHILLLNNDTLVEPDCLAAMRSALKERSDRAVCGSVIHAASASSSVRRLASKNGTTR